MHHDAGMILRKKKKKKKMLARFMVIKVSVFKIVAEKGGGVRLLQPPPLLEQNIKVVTQRERLRKWEITGNISPLCGIVFHVGVKVSKGFVTFA